MPKDFQMVGYSYQYTGTISIAVDDGNYNGAHISVTNGTDGTRIAPTYIWVGKSG
ncbi:MAG: hypothetical protein LBG59_03950 [Candidatus Peribacteria bacterium]|jgi:hypothetical protein|nr:hypothetical protein [Candidatus Peribacteria bacterium]